MDRRARNLDDVRRLAQELTGRGIMGTSNCACWCGHALGRWDGSFLRSTGYSSNILDSRIAFVDVSGG